MSHKFVIVAGFKNLSEGKALGNTFHIVDDFLYLVIGELAEKPVSQCNVKELICEWQRVGGVEQQEIKTAGAVHVIVLIDSYGPSPEGLSELQIRPEATAKIETGVSRQDVEAANQPVIALEMLLLKLQRVRLEYIALADVISHRFGELDR